jgi:hypothetical protein
MRRRIVALLLAVLAFTAGTPVTCAGWQPKAAERMACCQRAAHGRCHDQKAADDCCAQQEQTQQPRIIAGAAAQAGPGHAGVALASPAAVSLIFEPQPASRFRSSVSPRPHHPPPVFAPPLRI